MRLSSPTSMKPCNYVTPHSPHQRLNNPAPIRAPRAIALRTYICVTPLFLPLLLLVSFHQSIIKFSVNLQPTYTTHTHISTVWHWIWLSLMHWRCRRIKVTYSKSMTGVQVLNCLFQLSSEGCGLTTLPTHRESELEEAVEIGRAHV